MKKILLVMCWLLLIASLHAAETKQPPVRTIILVRHGNYVDDPSADARLGPGLSPLGAAQAHLVGARLAALPSGLDAMLVSPLRRARETAALIGEDFPGRAFTVVDDLAECTPPSRHADIMAHEKPADLAACKAQLERAFKTLFIPATDHDRTDLLVCHGNVTRYLVTRALGVDSTAWLELSVGHASMTVIRIDADGHFKVIAVGDVGHMPPNLRTGATGDADRSLAIPALP